jgi:DNA polymerase II
MNPKNIDYNHYIDKQIKPLVDGVLFAIDLSFDEIIEGRQLDLFS